MTSSDWWGLFNSGCESESDSDGGELELPRPYSGTRDELEI